MARKLNKLSARQIDKLRKVEGYHGDGGGLWLQGGGNGSWVFRYTRNGKTTDMGLGSLLAISVVEARDKAAEARRLLANRIDPIEARDAQDAQHALVAARTIMFKACAEAYIKSQRADWKNEKHGEQWSNTLATYAYPHFGALPVQEVDTPLVLKALEPIWTEIPETATRLRGRIERVLDWAKVRGYRDGDNPARWRGHLDKLLPKLEKRKRIKHHAALPFKEVGAFVALLRTQDGIAARALEFAILTATRTAEVIGARWSETSFKDAVWIIPAGRMKAHRDHRVPLSSRAIEVLRPMEALRHDEFVFPSMRIGKALSNMAMLNVLKRMNRSDLTVHGFRSTFRDWAAESTAYTREVCEMALAHTIGNATEEAYRRGDLFEKRRKLMADWSRYCGTTQRTGEVVPMRRKRVSP